MLKQCRTCKEFKEEDEFYNYGKAKTRPNRTGKQTECKICYRERSKKNSTPRKRRYNMVKFKYNLSKEELHLLEKKFPICPICKKEFGENEPVVDHCHKTGLVRGLLCSRCNHGLGNFRDSIEIIEKAISYLNRSAADCPNVN